MRYQIMNKYLKYKKLIYKKIYKKNLIPNLIKLKIKWKKNKTKFYNINIKFNPLKINLFNKKKLVVCLTLK
jgi:hypothetical protein